MKTVTRILFLLFIGINARAYTPYTVTVQSGATYDALPGNATIVAAANTALSTPFRAAIGFNFRYFGQMNDSVSINQNGQLSFSKFLFPDFIDAINTTLQPSATSQIAYGVIGSAPNRKFIVEWKNMNIKNANNPATITTFHIELVESSAAIVMMYNLAPNNNDATWYAAQYGLVMEIADIYKTYDLIFGNNLSSPTETNIAGTAKLKVGYGASFPANGTAYLFNYIKAAGAPHLKIVSPVSGTMGRKPVVIWWSCDSAVKVNIKVIVAGSTITLKSNQLSGKLPYYWYLTYNSTTFDLIIENADDPTKFDKVTGLKFDITGINAEAENSSRIKLFPNPCGASTTIDLSNINTKNQNGILVIYNMTGQIILMRAVNKETGNSIEIKDLKAGIYFVNLQINNEIYSAKLVAE
jgi:hypothetical protein